MIGSLQLQYNRGRQAVITNELWVQLCSRMDAEADRAFSRSIDIITGASAL